jgi:N4-gp56 family major capsid protein
VYPIVIVGQEAYGSTTLSGMGDGNISVINPGKPTKDDPMGQRGLVSWKFWFSAKILNELWIVRIESACRAL